MKKLLLFSMVLTIALITTSHKTVTAPPRIYPELTTFFKSIDVSQLKAEHRESLENLKSHIESSSLGYDDWNLVFYCSENSFRSQASQIFSETLCFKNKLRRVKSFSAGQTTGQIHPKLIDYLKKVGYKVSKVEGDGKEVYEIRYSDVAEPIRIFSKTTADVSLPKNGLMSIIVCDVKKENECSNLTTPTKPFNLPFEKVQANDPLEKAETVLRSIAVEITYVTGK